MVGDRTPSADGMVPWFGARMGAVVDERLDWSNARFIAARVAADPVIRLDPGDKWIR